MSNPVGRAGTGVITPLVKAGDSNSGAMNWSSIDRALASAGRSNGSVEFPAGPIFVDTTQFPALRITEERAFVTVAGAGRDKTLLIPTSGAFAPIGSASSLVKVRADGTFTVGGSTITTSGQPPVSQVYQPDEVVYFWKRATTTDARSPRQRMRVQFTSGTTIVNLRDGFIGDGLPQNPDDFMHIKGFAVSGTPAAGATSVTLVTPTLDALFSIGDEVLIGDGPGVNEFFGEWVRVTGKSGGVISFEPPLRQSYDLDKACIVPGWLNPLTERRQHMTDIVIRDLSIAAPTSGVFAGVFGVVRAGVRIHFENVGFVGSPYATTLQTLKEMAFATCGDLTIRNCYCDGKLLIGPCQNVTVDTVAGGSLAVGEFSRACNLLNIETRQQPGIEITGGLCTGVNLTNCVVRGAGATVKVLAKDARIENLTAPQLVLTAGSGGVLATPLAPDPTAVVDNTNAGDWLQPLQRRVKDRKIVSDAITNVTLELMARNFQTANILECENNVGTTLFGVRSDGNLIAKFEETGVPGSITARLAIYRPDGTVRGYLPLYSN